MLFKLMFHEFAKEKYEFAKSGGKGRSTISIGFIAIFP